MMKEAKPSMVPDWPLYLATQRDILAKDPYFKTPAGEILTYNGLLLERSNPQRIQRERQMVSDYLIGLDQSENQLIDTLLTDPTSNESVEPHQFGVEKINVRMFSPMDPECRVAVIVPARFEEERIGELLDGYSKQEGVDFKQFEVNIIVNHRVDEIPDKTSDVILNFMKKNPNVRINLVDLQFDQQHAKVGMARKLITDTVLARAVQRKDYASPLYIITEDADVNKIDPKIVKRTIEKLDSNPSIDTLKGRQDRSNALIAQNHLCAFYFRAANIAEIISHDKELRNPSRSGFDFTWNRVVSGGWACAFTAESYAMIKGFTDETLGEDMRIAQLISIARGSKDKNGNVIPFLETAVTFPVKEESNFLRWGVEILTGKGAYEMDQFNNQSIKKKSELDILHHLRKFNRLDPNNKEVLERFEQTLGRWVQFLRTNVGNDSRFIAHYAPRFLLVLGFKKSDYKFSLNEAGELDLVIENWQNLYSCLEKNRQKYEGEFHKRYI